MAITFEEKNNVGKNIAILFVLVAIPAAAVFFVWNFLRDSAPVATEGVPLVVDVDMKILENIDLASLDAFPQIFPVQIIASRKNPFVGQSADEIAAPKNDLLP